MARQVRDHVYYSWITRVFIGVVVVVVIVVIVARREIVVECWGSKRIERYGCCNCSGRGVEKALTESGR